MTTSGAGVVAGVCLSGGVTVRFFEACSFLAAARAGSFLFLSISASSYTKVACAAGSLCRGRCGLSVIIATHMRGVHHDYDGGMQDAMEARAGVRVGGFRTMGI